MKKILFIILLASALFTHAQSINGAVVSLANGSSIYTIGNDTSAQLTTAYLAVNMSGPKGGYITVTFMLYRSLYAFTSNIQPTAASIPTVYIYAMPAPAGIANFALSYSEPLMQAYLVSQGFTVKSTF